MASPLSESPAECLGALVMEIAKVMMGKVFCRDVYPSMTVKQRACLWALRSQALFGDAPDDSVGPVSQDVGKEEGQHPPRSTTATGLMDGYMVPAQKPRWYEFTKYLYYNTWLSLRGTMSAQVAAETFCSEFFYLLKLYPTPTMLPIMDAVLSRVSAKAAAVRNAGKSSLTRALAPRNGLYLHGCFDDPAVIAMLWLCRSYSIPCEADLQPVLTNCTLNHNYQFYVKALDDSSLVTDPLAAFILCVESYLPQSEHWLGAPPNDCDVPRTTRAAQKSSWMEYTLFVLLELRGTLLKFIQDRCEEKQFTSELQKGSILPLKDQVKRSSELSNVSYKRNLLLNNVITSLSRYEKYAHQYYNSRSSPVVSVAELMVAAYAFVLCTSAVCDDIIPLQESVPSFAAKADAQIPSQWAERGSHYSPRGENRFATQQARKVNALLNGVPKEGQDVAALILNGVINEQKKLSVQECVSEVLGKTKKKGGDSLSQTAQDVISRHQPWTNVEFRTNMLAIEAIDNFIVTRCRPLQPKLGSVFSAIWRMSNEQCEGFPFIVLNKDLREFVTTLSGHESSPPLQLLSRYSGNASAVTQMYWKKLRTALSGTSTSSEGRTYRNYVSKM
uniref:Uncharacterized protein n=1 Tax=Trypanosoma congolense (strain IL3000) TaxID=1068625 RepID=G0UY87_TRYCI|nr:conserved hypothetical protein [Trypanosoma congolense IL3000]